MSSLGTVEANKNDQNRGAGLGSGLEFCIFSISLTPWHIPLARVSRRKGLLQNPTPTLLDERGGQRMALGVALGLLTKKFVKLFYRGWWDLGCFQVMFNMLNRFHTNQGGGDSRGRESK